MGFTTDTLLHKGSRLNLPWVAAHHDRRISRQDVLGAHLVDSIREVIRGLESDSDSNSNPNSASSAQAGRHRGHRPAQGAQLRLVSHLLFGVVKLYARLVNYTVEDCNGVLEKLRLAYEGFHAELSKRLREPAENGEPGAADAPAAPGKRRGSRFVAQNNMPVTLDDIVADPAIRRALYGERLANIPGGDALLASQPHLEFNGPRARVEDITLKDVLESEAGRKLTEALSQTRDFLLEAGQDGGGGGGDNWWSLDFFGDGMNGIDEGLEDGNGDSGDELEQMFEGDLIMEDAGLPGPSELLGGLILGSEDGSQEGPPSALGVNMDWTPDDTFGKPLVPGTPLRPGPSGLVTPPRTEKRDHALVDRAAIDALKTPKTPANATVVELARLRAGFGLTTPNTPSRKTVLPVKSAEPESQRGGTERGTVRGSQSQTVEEDAIDFGWGDEDFQQKTGIYDRPGTPELVKIERARRQVEKEMAKKQKSIAPAPRPTGAVPVGRPLKQHFIVDPAISIPAAEYRVWLADTRDLLGPEALLTRRRFKRGLYDGGNDSVAFWEPSEEFFLNDTSGYGIPEDSPYASAWRYWVPGSKRRKLEKERARRDEITQSSQESQRSTRKAGNKTKPALEIEEVRKKPREPDEDPLLGDPADFDEVNLTLDDGPLMDVDDDDSDVPAEGILVRETPVPEPDEIPSEAPKERVVVPTDLRTLLAEQASDRFPLSSILPKALPRDAAAKLFHDVLVAATRGRGAVRVQQKEPFGEIEVEIVRGLLEGLGVAGWRKMEQEDEEEGRQEAQRRAKAAGRPAPVIEVDELDELVEDELVMEAKQLEEKRKGKRKIEGPNARSSQDRPAAAVKSPPRTPAVKPPAARKAAAKPKRYVPVDDSDSEDELVKGHKEPAEAWPSEDDESEEEAPKKGKRGKAATRGGAAKRAKK